MGDLYDPRGRSGRGDFLAASLLAESVLWLGAAALIIGIGGVGQTRSYGDWTGLGLPILFSLSLTLGWCASIRRLHDLGRAGWWVLLHLIPGVNLVFSLYLLFVPGMSRIGLTIPEGNAVGVSSNPKRSTATVLAIFVAALLVFTASALQFWSLVLELTSPSKSAVGPAVHAHTPIARASPAPLAVSSPTAGLKNTIVFDKIFGCNTPSNFAARRLVSQGDQSVGDLANYLESPEYCVRHLAIWALASIGTRSARDTLTRRQSHQSTSDEFLSLAINHLESGLQTDWEALVFRTDYYPRPQGAPGLDPPAGTLQPGALVQLRSSVKSQAGEIGARGSDQEYYEVFVRDSGRTVYIPVPADDSPIIIWRSRAD